MFYPRDKAKPLLEKDLAKYDQLGEVEDIPGWTVEVLYRHRPKLRDCINPVLPDDDTTLVFPTINRWRFIASEYGKYAIHAKRVCEAN